MTHSKTTQRFRLLCRDRRAITILETIIAILVAMIGVFGVFVMIPFAVRQAEVGLSEEAAMVIGKNTVANFESQGYHNIENWFDPIPANAPVGTISGDAEVFCIDPIGYAIAPLDEDPLDLIAKQARIDALARFPKMGAPPANIIGFRRLNLQDRNGNQFTWAMARRLFSGADDLVFTDATTELGAKEQAYIQDGSTDIKRQTGSQVSSMIFVVPEFDSLAAIPPPMPTSYRVYCVVYLNRTHDQTLFSGRPANDDRVFDVYLPADPPAVKPVDLQYGGGDFTVVEINQSTDPESEIRIRRNSWAMLIRAKSSPGTPVVEEVGFYRVIDASQNDGYPSAQFDVSLQGPDFNFKNSGPPTIPPLVHETYLVALPEVVAVYERTVRREELSNWNDN